MSSKRRKTTDEELVQQAYGRLVLWRDGCAPVHERARESRQVLMLRDPAQDRAGKPRTLQLQTLKSTFNNCIADQMDNMPEAVMIPETPALQQVAEDLTDVVRCILARNDYESLHRRRTEDCFCTGTAVTQVAWDPEMNGGRGDVALVRWPVEAFLWDPAAENLQDSRAVFKVSLHPMSWFEARWPQKAAQIHPDEGVYGILGAERDGAEGADEPKAVLLEYWWRSYDASGRKWTVSVAYLAGGVLLQRHEDVYRHGLYPFVMDVYTPVEGSPAGEGMVLQLAPMMRAINRYQSYIDTNLRMASKGRLLVDRSAGIDKDALCDWECDVIEGDRIDAGALQWLQTQPFGNLAMQQMLQLQADVKQDSGQNQFTRGEPVGGVTAASAISALQDAGGKITRLRTAGLNAGFRQMVEQMLWLIAQFYDRGRVVCITGRDGGVREIAAGSDRLFGGASGNTPLPYTVQIQVQRRNPLRTQAQNELFLQAYEMSAKAGQPFPLSVLFELLQVDGKEKVLPVIRGMEAGTGMGTETGTGTWEGTSFL